MFLPTLLVFLFGLSIGSFINAFEWRLYRGKSIMWGRSQCRYCSYVLKATDLVPLFSFAWLRGKCRECQKKISWQYPFVELITGILFVLALYHVNLWQSALLPWGLLEGVQLLRELFIIAVLVFLFIFDLKYYLLPDIITIPAFFIIILLTLPFIFIWPFDGFLISQYLGGIAFGAAFFGAQYIVSRGKWIGGGDIRLGALMGAMVSWPLILLALFISYISGSVIGVYLLSTKKKQMKSVVPFGTFLAVGTVITLFWGSAILDWYLRLLM